MTTNTNGIRECTVTVSIPERRTAFFVAERAFCGDLLTAEKSRSPFVSTTTNLKSDPRTMRCGLTWRRTSSFRLFKQPTMSKPPPFIYGVTRFWAIAPSDDSQSKLFPVSRELYFAVRIILKKWTEDLVNLRDWDIRKQCRSIQV